MLTVWSLCWGDKYPDYYVQRLQKSVADNLTIAHEFKCLTDRQIEGVDCVPFTDDFQGWWAKVQLFRWDTMADRNLWLDLDVVVTGDLTEMIAQYSRAPLAMPWNWAASGHGGCQSSVMLWTKNYNTRQIYDLYDPNDPRVGTWPPSNAPGKLWGDQEWITELRDSNRIDVHQISPDWIKSYKYHCQDGLPDKTKVVVFHGDPKPHQVKASWFQW